MIRPTRDRVILRRVKEEEQKGTILIPDVAKEKPLICEVVAVGKGWVSDLGNVIPVDLQPGDRVMIGKYSGSEVEIDGEKLLIVPEADVMVVINEG